MSTAADAGPRRTMPLPRYRAILDGDRPAYLRTREAGAYEASSRTDPWKVHDDFLKSAYPSAEPPAEGDRPNAVEQGWEAGPEETVFDLKRALARSLASPCRLCPRDCRAERPSRRGWCGVGRSRLASAFLHWGEEPELVPSHTLFFSGCNLRCVFCQNWEISTNPDAGALVDPVALGALIDAGWSAGARNTNWVGGDPIPHLPTVLTALAHASAPIAQVWNSNMYMNPAALDLLGGVIDLFIADLKYGPGDCASLSSAPGYWSVVTRNIQKAQGYGDLLVRHLVLPGHVACCSLPVMEFLSRLDKRSLVVNVMAQYHPDYRAAEVLGLGRRPTAKEVATVRSAALDLGLDLIE